MKELKVLMLVAAICAITLVLLFVWNEDSIPCDWFTVKLFETVFFITALAAVKEYTKIKA